MAAGVDRIESPLVVIAGPTASGKTALAIRLARVWDGEIICADSRTIYKDMNIGTAKPTSEEREAIPHWGLDLVEPGGRFSAADFQDYTRQKIAEIRARGRVPFLVGGTGLYIDAVLFEYKFGLNGDATLRQRFEKLSIPELHEYCYNHNVELPGNDQNKRYIIRAIEQNGINDQRNKTPLSRSIIVGIATDRQELRTRIETRSEQLFHDGVVDEAILLGKKYGWKSEAMTGNVYPLVHAYLEGELSLSKIKDKFTTLDWRLAKRQLTWLRRNPYIVWGGQAELEHYVSDQLALLHNSCYDENKKVNKVE